MKPQAVLPRSQQSATKPCSGQPNQAYSVTDLCRMHFDIILPDSTNFPPKP
jgi:hypothetical protein